MGKQLQPIRDINTVQRITQELAARTDARGRRTFLLWVVGINMGMRIGDILDLKVGDLRDKQNYTYLPRKQRHKKGAHNITIPIPPDVRKVVAARCADQPDGAWLLQSRKKRPTRRDGSVRRDEETVPGRITRETAHADIVDMARRCGIDMAVGCHTMRKTFGYHYYQKTHDVALLQEWFYHENPGTTLLYIGVSLDNFNKMVARSPFSLDGVDV